MYSDEPVGLMMSFKCSPVLIISFAVPMATGSASAPSKSHGEVSIHITSVQNQLRNKRIQVCVTRQALDKYQGCRRHPALDGYHTKHPPLDIHLRDIGRAILYLAMETKGSVMAPRFDAAANLFVFCVGFE